MEPSPSNPSNRPPQVQQHPLANYEFNADELRVLRECNTESFFQRSLPFGTGFGLAAYYGVKNGMLAPNVKYGSVPKVVVGVIVGYFLGKFSYQQKCMEKIMQLPNSPLADILRKRQKGGGMMGTITGDGMGMGLGMSPFTPTNADVYSDEHLNENTQGSALNLDSDRNPTFSGLDDIYRPSLDNPNFREPEPTLVKPPPQEPKYGPSHADLRQRQRDEYMRRRRDTTPKENNESDSGSTAIKNKYGDTWTG